MTDLVRVAAWLFLVQGAVYLVIGALTPIFLGRDGNALFFTPRSDSGYFGGDIEDLKERDPNLAKLSDLILLALAGLLVGLGLAVAAIAWFGLRTGHPWGYWSLVAIGALMVPYWIAVVGKYVAAGGPISLADIPPFMWFTTLLWATGTALGAFGLRAA